jgi:hypothetical protein
LNDVSGKITGPPKVQPKSLKRNGGTAAAKKERAANMSLRTNSKMLPWKSRVPFLVTTLTIDPLRPPNSAL